MSDAAVPVQQSFLNWVYLSLGAKYALLLPVAGLLSFVLALAIVIRGKGPMAVAALLLIAHVPMLIGIFAGIEGAMSSYTVIAMSAQTPKPSEVASGISMALVCPMFGILMMIPAYAVAAIGAFARSFASGSDRTPEQ